MAGTTPAIAASYAAAAKIARHSGSSFTRSFRLLPPGKRQAMTVLYAFARISDDLGDCHEPATLKKTALEAWRQTTAVNLIARDGSPVVLPDELQSVRLDSFDLTQTATELMPALRHAADRYSIPSRYLLEIIDGVLADQSKNRFDTFEQLEHYCYLVASAVGIACLHIWGFTSPMPMRSAIDCGLAFQLTNILRDVREDAARGRIYLPRQHYEQHGLSEDDLLQPRRDARLRCLIADEAVRAANLYDSGWGVFESLSDDGRPMFSMMWRTYRKLLQTIAQDPDAVVGRRVRLGAGERIGLVSSHLIGPLYRRLPVPPSEFGQVPMAQRTSLRRGGLQSGGLKRGGLS